METGAFYAYADAEGLCRWSGARAGKTDADAGCALRGGKLRRLKMQEEKNMA